MHAVADQQEIRGTHEKDRCQQDAREPQAAEPGGGDQCAYAHDGRGQDDRDAGLAEKKVVDHGEAQRQKNPEGDDVENARKRIALGVIGITRTGQELLDSH